MSMNNPPTVKPAAFGGYGRQKGPYGSLENLEFVSKCPPDIQRNTRIVAVCGIPASRAAPQDDGWFYSEFFLFYQMLKSRNPLPNQLWLCSRSPTELIEKHTRYLHGPATGIEGDRRVVMSKDLLPRNELADGFRVVPEKYLLERFLVSVKDEAAAAARENQPLLLLLFGHGEEGSSDVFIGCDDGGSFRLTKDRLVSVLKREVHTTLIMTSCFSGGWLMKPNLESYFKEKPIFNHSFLTAADNDNVSLSWAVSQTVGKQAAGSVFATCLLQSIITTSTTEGWEMEERLSSVNQNNEGQFMADTMAALSQKVFSECKKRDSGLFDEHKFSFSVQDDRWERSWGSRTGLPLIDYKQRWDNLPDAPLRKEIYPPGGPMAGSARSKSTRALQNIIAERAALYMNSKPGIDNSGANTSCHPGFRRLLNGDAVDDNELYRLMEVLEYRLGQIGLAEIYCHVLNIGVPDHKQARYFDEHEWKDKQATKKEGQNAAQAKAAVELRGRYDSIHGNILRLGIFDKPYALQGSGYVKPRAYLSARLAETMMPIDLVIQSLQELVQYKLKDARCAAYSDLGVEILNEPEIKSLRGRLYKSVGKLTHRLRSLSPRKRSSKPEAWN